jgi:hypothetical protein
VLAGGAEGEAEAPGEPGRAGGEAVVPPGDGIELADEVEQAADSGNPREILGDNELR